MPQGLGWQSTAEQVSSGTRRSFRFTPGATGFASVSSCRQLAVETKVSLLAGKSLVRKLIHTSKGGTDFRAVVLTRSQRTIAQQSVLPVPRSAFPVCLPPCQPTIFGHPSGRFFRNTNAIKSAMLPTKQTITARNPRARSLTT